jgi:hypothetical protein
MLLAGKFDQDRHMNTLPQWPSTYTHAEQAQHLYSLHYAESPGRSLYQTARQRRLFN